MIDLTYLDPDEPWSPGSLEIFSSLQNDNRRFVLAIERLSKHMADYGLTLSSWSASPPRIAASYVADWYVSFYSDLHKPVRPYELEQGVKQWRFSRSDFVFKLTRYSDQDVIESHRSNHRGHFVITNKPEDFPSTTIKLF